MSITIQPATPAERLYAYSQSQQIDGQIGCIGHLRADFGSGKEFYTTWFDHRRDLKTQDFKEKFDAVINSLRDGKCFADKHGNEILEHDILKFDDGTSAEVGFHVPAADPKHYDELGNPAKFTKRNRLPER